MIITLLKRHDLPHIEEKPRISNHLKYSILKRNIESFTSSSVILERNEMKSRLAGVFSFLDDVSTHEYHGTLGESLFENRPFRNRPFVDDEVASADKRGENWLTDKPDGGETLIDSYWLAT